tara:strand:- start:46817 stop:47086 length:270 start_codon:yes stop_codon:yes gene_type:complete
MEDMNKYIGRIIVSLIIAGVLAVVGGMTSISNIELSILNLEQDIQQVRTEKINKELVMEKFKGVDEKLEYQSETLKEILEVVKSTNKEK